MLKHEQGHRQVYNTASGQFPIMFYNVHFGKGTKEPLPYNLLVNRNREELEKTTGLIRYTVDFKDVTYVIFSDKAMTDGDIGLIATAMDCDFRAIE